MSTTIEQLSRIRAKCVELLEIASKRTPGKWGVEQTENTNWVGPMRPRGPKINEIVVSTDRENLVPETILRNDNNARFIASCAGPAESGWKATIAAIDFGAHVEPDGSIVCKCNGCKMISSIISAWPEELL